VNISGFDPFHPKKLYHGTLFKDGTVWQQCPCLQSLLQP